MQGRGDEMGAGLPVIYLLFTAAVALIGNASLISTGEINPFFSLVSGGMLWGYARAVRGREPPRKAAVAGLAGGAFAVFVADALLAGDVLLCARIALAHNGGGAIGSDAAATVVTLLRRED